MCTYIHIYIYICISMFMLIICMYLLVYMYARERQGHLNNFQRHFEVYLRYLILYMAF